MAALPRTPMELIGRMSSTDRASILKALLEVDATWLSERKRDHLLHGRRMHTLALEPADFKRAVYLVARERRTRLLLALVRTTGEPPGAARLATWERVDLEKRHWYVPRAHLPKAYVQRTGMVGREKTVPLGVDAADVFRKASQVGDGWKLLWEVLCKGGRVPYPREVYAGLRPARANARRKGLVFPLSLPDSPCKPLPEHAPARCLRALLALL